MTKKVISMKPPLEKKMGRAWTTISCEEAQRMAARWQQEKDLNRTDQFILLAHMAEPIEHAEECPGVTQLHLARELLSKDEADHAG